MTKDEFITLEPVTDPYTGRVVYQAAQPPQIIGGDLVPSPSPNQRADSVTLTDDKFAARSFGRSADPSRT